MRASMRGTAVRQMSSRPRACVPFESDACWPALPCTHAEAYRWLGITAQGSHEADKTQHEVTAMLILLPCGSNGRHH